MMFIVNICHMESDSILTKYIIFMQSTALRDMEKTIIINMLNDGTFNIDRKVVLQRCIQLVINCIFIFFVITNEGKLIKKIKNKNNMQILRLLNWYLMLYTCPW